MRVERKPWLGLMAGVAALMVPGATASAEQQNGPEIIMLMTDDAGWNDFGAYPGGRKNGPQMAATHDSVPLTKHSSMLPIQCIKECYLTQSSTGGYTIEYCRPFVPRRFYGMPRLRRFRSGSCL